MTFRKFVFKFLRALSYPVVVPYYGIMKLWYPTKYQNFDIFGNYTDIGFANELNKALTNNNPFTLQTLVQEGIFNYRANMQAKDLLLEVLSKMPDNNHFAVVCKDLYDFMPNSEKQDYDTFVTVIIQAMKQPTPQNRQNSLNLFTFINQTFGDDQFLKTVDSLIDSGTLSLSDLTKLLQNAQNADYLSCYGIHNIALSKIMKLTPNANPLKPDEVSLTKLYFQYIENCHKKGYTRIATDFLLNLQKYPMLRTVYCDYVKDAVKDAKATNVTNAKSRKDKIAQLVASLVTQAASSEKIDYDVIKELRLAYPNCLYDARTVLPDLRDNFCLKDFKIVKQLFKFTLNRKSIDVLNSLLGEWYPYMREKHVHKFMFKILKAVLSVKENAFWFFGRMRQPYLQILSNNQLNYVFSHSHCPAFFSDLSLKYKHKCSLELQIKRSRLSDKTDDSELLTVTTAQNTLFKKFVSTMTTNDLKRFNFTNTALQSCNSFNLVCKGFYDTVSAVTFTVQNICVPAEIVNLIKQFVFIDQIRFIKRDDCKALEYLEDLKLTSTSSPQALSDKEVAELKELYGDHPNSLQKHIELHALAHRNEKSV